MTRVRKFGAAGVVAVKLLGSMGTLVTLSLITLFVWVILPLYVALRIFEKQSL